MEHKRGFKEFRKHIKNRERFIASCSSCFFMQDFCTNGNVTEFDMVKAGGRTYCIFWRHIVTKKKEEDF
jgi:hypothetical protein